MLDIMLPFYGREDHFRAAVESVLAQDCGDWRLVILDDAYPDTGPGRWARDITDPRVEYRRNDQNMGINRSFQTCLDLSTAPWVCIFGCDDVMGPGYVRRVAQLTAQFPDAGIVHPGADIIDADGRPARTLVDTAKALYRPKGARPRVLGGEALAVSITRGNWMNFPAIAWHGPTVREVGFRDDYQIVQDLALALDVCRTGRTLVLDDEIVFHYRRHGGSVSSWRAADGTRFSEERAFFVSEAAVFDSEGWHRAARAARWHISSRINAATQLIPALRARDRAGARSLLAHALRP